MSKVVGWLLVTLPFPWDAFLATVATLAWAVVMAGLVIPSRNVYGTFGWPAMTFMWFVWLCGWNLAVGGWATLVEERRNLDDALAISVGATNFLGRTGRIVKMAYAFRLHWAAGRWVVGMNLLFWPWLVALLWWWWLTVLPLAGFAWRLATLRRNWWERA